MPTISDNIEFSTDAQFLGGVRIGNNCRIIAMSLVLYGVPNDATCVGVPAQTVEMEPHSSSYASEPAS